MIRLFFFAAKRLPIAFGVLGVWFAIHRWLWFHTLPSHAPARFCGNCFLAAVGVPTELGLLGLLAVARSLLGFPCNSRTVMYGCFAAMGILLTPHVIGVPLFAFAFLMLLLFITSVFKGAVPV